MRNKIASKIADNWPVEDVVVTCNDCDSKLYSMGNTVPATPDVFASHIFEAIDRHHALSRHLDIDVDIYPNNPVDEIDVEITVQ